ncbi:MAG: sodium/proline symporter [Dorea sp.]|jgi:sodium/proline symporter|nr:sodium/proline symporter [Dorea sp.]MCI9248174.1 sodium/proline symporter [Dorea sp.]
MSGTSIIILCAILAYMCLLIGVGFYNSRKNSTSEDFYLGGRKMGALVVAMSAEASDMSSWLLMGLPGVAYLTGIADAFWTAAGLAVGTYLNWLFTSRRLRRYSEKIDAITVPNFFAKRFHDEKNIITAISAIIIVVFFIPYVASGFAACGKLFNSLFGLDYMTGVILFAIIIVIYTIMGGFTSVATNDLIQSIVMSIALISIVTFGVSSAGGFGAVMDNAKSLPGYFSLSAIHDAVAGTAVPYSALSAVSLFAWGIGYFGMPHILVRFMAIEDEGKLVLSRRVASIWVTIAMGVAIFIGVVGLGVVKAGNMAPLEDSERVIIALTDILSKNGFLAAVLGGVILAGILAATMSTADSQMLVAASGVSENIVQDFFGKKLTEKQSLMVARGTILAIAAIGLFLAKDPNSSVFGIVSFAWAGMGAAFAGVMICALFWKRTTLQGALAGMISGGAMVFIWKYAVRPMGGILDIYELLPAFLVSLAMIIIVSLATKAPSQEILDEFESVNAKK